MLIYTQEITTRLDYTFEFVFGSVLQVPYQIETNLNSFISSNSKTKWSYGRKIENFPNLEATSLLFEKDIRPQELNKIEFDNCVGLFRTTEENGTDVFATIFYLISRYEEYLPAVIDKHGRYAGYQSIAVEYDFVEKLMVNRLISWLRSWLIQRFPELSIQVPKSSVLFSFDIDHPFYSKDISLDRWLVRAIREKSLMNERDKFDTFEFILDTLGEIPSIFFILCPKDPSEHDHYNKRDSKNFQSLILEIKSRSKIGIHPSYLSESNDLLVDEINWLSQIHSRHIKSSRFHYLKNNMETSYQQLSKAGIANDFSMAYGDISGWRSSTSFPYNYFDLKKNKETSIKVYSPCIMDSTFEYNYQNDYESRVELIYKEILLFGGIFLPIFHNDILAKGEWKERFTALVNMIQNR